MQPSSASLLSQKILLQTFRYGNKLAFMKSFLPSLLLCSLPALLHAELTVATLHPMLTDLATQVGGAEVKVVALVKPGPIHINFSPKPADLKKLKDVNLVLASGKQLENYLGKLKDNLSAQQQLVEIGAQVPDLTEKQSDALKLEPEEEHHHEEGEHHHHGADPHWWNGVDNMKRAASLVATALGKADAAHCRHL